MMNFSLNDSPLPICFPGLNSHSRSQLVIQGPTQRQLRFLQMFQASCAARGISSSKRWLRTLYCWLLKPWGADVALMFSDLNTKGRFRLQHTTVSGEAVVFLVHWCIAQLSAWAAVVVGASFCNYETFHLSSSCRKACSILCTVPVCGACTTLDRGNVSSDEKRHEEEREKAGWGGGHDVLAMRNWSCSDDNTCCNDGQ